MSENASDPIIATLPGIASSQPPRSLPQNILAEQSFIGALLLDNEVMDRLEIPLRAEHFHDPVHGQIYEAAARLIGRGQLANPVTLKAFFANSTAFGDDGADAYLGDLVDGVISVSDAPNYADVVHEAYLRRELVRISDQVTHDAQNPDLERPAMTQIEAAEQYLFSLAETDSSDNGLRSFDVIQVKRCGWPNWRPRMTGICLGLVLG